MPSVDQLNLNYLVVGLAWGAGVAALGLVWPLIRPLVPAALAAAIVVQVGVDAGDRITPALTWGAVIIAVALGVAGWSVARHGSPPIIGLVALMSLVGCWACLPDTEAVLITIGVVTPSVLVMFWRVPLTGTLVPALAAAVAWVIALSAVGRPAAAVGAAGCFGVVLLLPLLATFDRHIWSLVAPEAPLATTGVVLVTQAVIIGLCARVAGVSDDIGFATWVTAATLAAGAVALTSAARVFSVRSQPT